MKPFITVGSRTSCRKCGSTTFDRIEDDEDGILIPMCRNCKIGKPLKYRVGFSLPQIGTNKFKKYLKTRNELGENLDTLTKAKNFKSYIENKIKKEGVHFDPRELGSEDERKIFFIQHLLPLYLKEQEKRLKRKEITPGGYRKIERVCRLYLKTIFGNFHVKHLSKPKIKREILKYSKEDGTGLTPSVCTEICKVLSPFLGYAVDMELILTRPEMPKFEKQVTYKSADFYTLEEQKKVIQNIKNQKHKIAITILAMYSARKCEVECLTWGDIDFKRETIKFDKHVSEGQIIKGLKSSPQKCLIYPFFPGLKGMLTELVPSLQNERMLFERGEGKLIGKNALWKSWTDSVNDLIKRKELKKKVDLHRGTRSSTLSALYEKGYSVEELTELYGGDTKTMLKHYAKKEVQNVAHLWNGSRK